MDKINDLSRRDALRLSALSVGATLAGCSGQSEEGGGATSPTEGTQTETATATPLPTFDGTDGTVEIGLGDIPRIVAVREFIPEMSDGRYQTTVKQFNSDTLSLQTLIAGQTDSSGIFPPTVYQGYVSGNTNLRLPTPISQGTDYVMAVSEDVSLSDFEGGDASFGISTPGALSHLQPMYVFKEKGIDTDKIDFIKIGSSGNRTSALASGQIQGAALHESQLRQLENEGAGVKMTDKLRDYFPNFIQNSLVTTTQFINKHPNYYQTYIDALVRANEKASNDFEWVFQKLQKYQATERDKESVKQEWELQANELEAWPYEKDDWNEDSYQRLLDLAAIEGQINPDEVDLDELVTKEAYDAAVK